LDDARLFQEFFPDAEHVIVQAKLDLPPEGWTLADEWISRAKLYDRYVLWLVVPIEFTVSGDVSPLEQPAVYIVEVGKVEKGRKEKGGPKWECNFGEGDWKELIEAGGDFEALGADLITDSPVEGFATFWRDTSPPPEAPAPDGLALIAPLRFIS
jgi:hypothetical protein